MTIGSAVPQLQDELKKLLLKWEESQALWDDKVRDDFEQNFIIPMRDQARNTLQAMEQLAVHLYAMKQDCN